MDEEVARYNQIYTDKPNKWASVARNILAYSLLSKYDVETLLDIGCGNGHTIEFFREQWPNTVYYGIDLSGVAIDIAKEKMPDVWFMTGDYKNYTLIPHCDVVLVMGVVEHFEDLVDGLKSLKDYGTLIYLEVPDCLRMGAINGTDNYDEGFRETYLGGLQVEWHLKKSSWEEKIELAGLEILDSTVLDGTGIMGWCWVLV